jgi:acetyl-CoA/propionyl-CoA carboxylase biotin carboxyl carrier protein
MFRRVLIANRGEIAVRVIRACREMDIATAAVYSDADAGALHVALADRAVRIGPAPAAQSYLSVNAIVDAARRVEADAVHPGYGFLSERAVFARACAEAGLVFIGPPAGAIERMGSKIAARDLARTAGVPLVAGETPADQTTAAITASVRRIGVPALLKPSAGGGGIGMVAIRGTEEIEDAIGRARREAKAAFGDDALYVERLLSHPRHVEVQVFGDAHGSVVHLFERECSLQRRHQKVVEESPSPVVTRALRRRMGDAAVALAKAAGYQNAGTVEFLVEGTADDARFYFLEMNTRLQVEHPVTEQVTGVDLVRAQLLVAAGERLPWAQAELEQRGHAIEARVYAEDPARGHLPQPGPLLLYRPPAMPGVRVDTGVAEGDVIPPHYDPLIAKVIAHGATRDAARRRLLQALQSFPILGIRTNIPFLVALLDHPRFVAGNVDTGFLDTETAALVAGPVAPLPPAVTLVARAALAPSDGAAQQGVVDPWSTVARFRV